MAFWACEQMATESNSTRSQNFVLLVIIKRSQIIVFIIDIIRSANSTSTNIRSGGINYSKLTMLSVGE